VTRFLLAVFVLTILVMVTMYSGIFRTPSYAAQIVLYVAASTGLIYYLVQRRDGALFFTQSYLLSIVVKILMGCAFILIVLYVDPTEASANATLFIVCYLLFTTVEVIFLFNTVKRGRK
jgi:hypothetical protein